MTPRNCVVLGAARNGTSIMSGMISSAGGHCLGPRVWPGNEWNAAGYFESQTVNDVNDHLLSGFSSRTGWEPGAGARWLSAPAGTELDFSGRLPAVAATMDALVAEQPFCLKDPRFCYTLPAWGRRLHDAVRVVMFREPVPAAASLARFAAAVTPCRPTVADGLILWRYAYERILRQTADGEWLFVHLRQLGDESARRRIGERIGVRLEPSLLDPGKLAPSAVDAEPAIFDLYSELCGRAGMSV